MAITATGTSTSMGNTPQAGDDLFGSTGVTEDGGSVILDVMANDLGGKAKTLYSLDNGAEIGDASAYSDLLAKDAIGSVQYSQLGAEIRITAEGKVSYTIVPAMNLQALAQGETTTDTFTYAIRLGNGTLSWATASVTIIGTNDAPTVTALNSSVNEGDGTVSVDGLTGAHDVDHGAVLSVVQTDALPAGVTITGNAISLDANHAAYDHLAAGATQDVTVTYGVSDEHGAVTNNTVTFTVTGTNDAPTVEGPLTAAVNEGSSASVNGLTGAHDVDDGAVLHVVAPASAPAGVTVVGNVIALDAANAAYDHLAAGATQEVTVDYGVSDGTVTTANSVTFTVTGVNDAAVIGGTSTGDVTEDASNPLTTAGNLTVADVDDGQSSFQAAADVAGLYGHFSIDTAGHWTYTADNSSAAIQGLDSAHTLTDSFTAHTFDGTAQEITVTIHGVNEPVIVTEPSVPATDSHDYDSLATGGPTNGTSGDDVLYGTSGKETINGQAGNDTIYGGAGNDVLNGQDGVDTLYGGSGDDKLNGHSGNDILDGGTGNDTITGFDGQDTLIGGAGSDTFVFVAVTDSTVAAPDVISGFQHGVDKIDLSAIDANTATPAVDDAFTFGGHDANTAAHGVTWSEAGDHTVIHIDVNGDATPDMQIVLTGTGLGLTAGDFVL